LLLAGALFELPFLLDGRAGGNDVFLINLLLSPFITLLGGLLYILALRRLGLSLGLMSLLLVLNLALLTSWLWLPQVTPQGVALAIAVLGGIPGILLLDAALLFAVGALVATRHAQRGVWTRAALLAITAGALLAVIYYFFGGSFLAYGETSRSLPPYLNGVVLEATLALTIVVYLLVWLWGIAARRAAQEGAASHQSNAPS
jgi:hypothetical protein